MDFKDYYATLGLARTATAEEIKRAYRKLARKYHPDVSKEPQAEERFKEVAEAYEALSDVEKRAAYDAVGTRHAEGRGFDPAPGWDSGFEFSGGDGDGGAGDGFDRSDFFASLFGRRGAGRGGARRAEPGGDRHAKVTIGLEDAYRGGVHTISLRVPQPDAQGRMALLEKQIELNIPKGVRAGQHLRLAGQGDPGAGDAPAGDLFLEIEIAPHARFRVDGRDVLLDLPVAPWEAALGARIAIATPDGSVELAVPAGSAAGRRLRLRGKGLPSVPPGDLFVVLSVVLPAADSEPARAAYAALAQAFADFKPRAATES